MPKREESPSISESMSSIGGSIGGALSDGTRFAESITDTISDAIGDVMSETIPVLGSIEQSSFDPVPHPEGVESRRWWGRHFREIRWQAELLRLLADPVYRGVGVPRGDGSPVLLIPGFLAGDGSLSVMANWLRRLGYEPHGADIVLNVDCSDRTLDRLERRLAGIARKSGDVAIIGHSRGGHLAKALAHRRPELVSQVISLGSGLDTPFDISIPTKAAVAGVRTILHRTSRTARANGCFTPSCQCPFTRDYTGTFPPDVPLTSVHSQGDGVVWWEACVVPYARNVEVTGSHIGLAFNRKAYRVIGETLARSVGDTAASAAS
ncbi:MAG: alpha/beta hydrolase [Actinomycetota bacterium]|nr:alpha/beta hydrolase [Actinomycetota bacterium]